MPDGVALPFAIPAGLTPVPIDQADAAAPVRLCVLVRTRPDPVLGDLVVMEEMFDGRRFLGCLLDRSSRVIEWLDISVQTVDGVSRIWEFGEREFSNARLDERWSAYHRSLVESGITGVVTTGWEARHPPPLFIDSKSRQAWVPGVGNAAKPWELCLDDALLARHNLPCYGSSLHRYLYVPAMGDESRFVPLCDGSPTNDSTAALTVITEGQPGLIPLNLGGLLLVRTLRPLAIDVFADLIAGTPWDGHIAGKTQIVLPGPWSVYAPDGTDRRGIHGLFSARASRGVRLCEVLHLKLSLLEQAFREVEAFVKVHRRPLLGLTGDSFRMDCPAFSGNLPAYWSAAVRLVDPGCAIPAPVQKDGAESYMSTNVGVSQAYTPPEFVKIEVRGRGTVLIREVETARDGVTSFKGTLRFRDHAEAAENDLITLRLALGNRSRDVFAYPVKEMVSTASSCSFQTYPERLPEAQVRLLQQAIGAQFPNTVYRLTPMVDTPCDLYGLAILAVRLLLSGGRDRFGPAIDDVVSLAHAVAAIYNKDEPVEQRVCRVIATDPGFWVKALGPHHLVAEVLPPEEAFAYIPEDVWFALLGLIVQLFPAVGGDSFCQRYSSAPALAKHAVFLAPLARLEDLVTRTRSLIVADFVHNIEILDLLEQFGSQGAGT